METNEEPTGWKARVRRDLDQIGDHIRAIRTEVEQDRQNEIVDRLQDVESEVKTLSSEIQSSTWAGAALDGLRDPRVAITFILLIAVIVFALILLNSNEIEIGFLSDSVYLIAAPVSGRTLFGRIRYWVQKKYAQYRQKDDQDECDGKS